MPKAVKPIYVNEEEGVVGETKKVAGQNGAAVKSGSQMSGAVRVLPAAFAYEDAAHQREKLRARMKEEEDRLTDEISEGLDNVTRLASQHLSQRYPQLAKKETLDETDKEDNLDSGDGGAEALTVAEKVHTLSYRSSVLVSRTNGIDATDEDDQTQKQEKIMANQETTESEDHHDDDGEHTYANLGVTFVHLTEKMKSVVSQMSSGNGHCEEEYSRLSDDETAAGKALDGDGLPYIDEAASASGKESSPSDSGGDGGSGAALDDAIAAASGLDRSQVVDRVELSSQAEATPVELVTRQQRRTDDETDTEVQQSPQTSRGRVVIVRSDLGEV